MTQPEDGGRRWPVERVRPLSPYMELQARRIVGEPPASQSDVDGTADYEERIQTETAELMHRIHQDQDVIAAVNARLAERERALVDAELRCEHERRSLRGREASLLRREDSLRRHRSILLGWAIGLAGTGAFQIWQWYEMAQAFRR